MSRIGIYLFGMALFYGIGACGPAIQLVAVEVKLPAIYPVDFVGKEIAIFNKTTKNSY